MHDAGECPDLETIAAYVDGRLGPGERGRIAAHLAGCPDCYFVFSEAAQTHVTKNAVEPDRRTGTAWWKRPRVAWPAAAALATAASVWIAVGTLFRAAQPELQALVAAVGTDRTIEGRLTGGFAYGPVRGVVRAGEPSAVTVSPDVRIAAAQIEKDAAANRTPRTLHALGTAYLLQGDTGRAVDTLEQVADATKNDARVLSDLSAAYLAQAVRGSEPQDFAKALTAAERATRADPKLPEAWFNRAYALERLSLADQAKQGWQDYLKVDATSGWADEARRRLKALETADQSSALDQDRRAIASAAARGLSAEDAEWFVKKSPDAVRTWIEMQLIAEWPRRVLAGSTADAASVLARVEPLSEAVARVHDDVFFRDAAASASRAARDRAAARALAAALEAYATAADAYDADRVAESAEAASAVVAPLETAGNPFALYAARYRAIGAYYKNDFASAVRDLASMESSARDRRYARVLGLAYRLEGLTFVVQGQYAKGLDAYQAALRTFQASGDTESEADIQSALAEGFQFVGDAQQSWHARESALSLLDTVRDPGRRYRILQSASLSALRDDLPEASLVLQEAALDNARHASLASAIITGHLNRASIYERLGRAGDAAGELAEADRSLGGVRDPLLVSRNEARIALARAETLARRDPGTAIAAVDRALGYFGRSGTSWPIASAYLARGRAHVAARRPDLAEQDFRAGIDVFERMRSALTSEALRTSYFEQPWDLFTEMIRLQADRRDGDRALQFAEQARARTLLERVDGRRETTPIDPAAVRRAMPTSVAVVYFASLDDRLLIWVLTHGGQSFLSTPTRQADLVPLVDAWRAAAGSSTGSDTLAALYDRLVRPVAASLPDRATLVVVPDGVLHAVPFAALLRREDHRYLVEDHAIATTPSLTMFARSAGRAAASRAPASALVVGDPRAASGVAALPDAAREADAIAAFYPERSLLADADATKAAFVSAAGRFEVVHFAGHGVSNDDYPSLSRLILAGDGESNRSLFANEIAAMHFDRTALVVLAACRTSAGRIRRGEGVLSLARPFIAAGVPTVVASLWDVDDRATQAVFVVFHRALRDGAPVADALRAAQLAAMAQPDSVIRNPANWASFEVIGGLAALRRSSN